MAGDKRAFPNATVYVQRDEMEFWLDGTNATKIPESWKRWFNDARGIIEMYQRAGRIKTFDGVTELFPGISVQPAPGHTPGHSFYVIEE